jgi:hypothetical protein
MPIEIRETTVSPNSKGTAVRLQISDAPLHPESVATFHLDLTVTLPEYAVPPLLVQFQAQAIRKAQEVLRQVDDQLLQDIRKQPHIDVEPRAREQMVRRS